MTATTPTGGGGPRSSSPPRPRDALGRIHDRTPVVVPAHLHGDWLNPALTDPAELRELLAAVPEPQLHPVEVSTAVNNVHTDNPDLTRPVTTAA